jgi:hypothetical protein
MLKVIFFFIFSYNQSIVMNAFMHLVDDHLVPPHGILHIYVIF